MSNITSTIAEERLKLYEDTLVITKAALFSSEVPVTGTILSCKDFSTPYTTQYKKSLSGTAKTQSLGITWKIYKSFHLIE